MLLVLRNSTVLEFTLFLPEICSSVFELKPSKHLSLKIARLMQLFKRSFRVVTRLLHSSSSGTGRRSIKYPWVSKVWPGLTQLITVSSFLYLLYCFNGLVSCLISMNFSSFSFHSVFQFSCMTSLIFGNRS